MHNLAAQSLELTTYVAAVHKIYVVVAELISPTTARQSPIQLQYRLYHDLIEFLCAWCHLESSVESTVPVKKASKGLVRG